MARESEKLDDNESDWSLFADWQRIVSLFVALAYLVLIPIVFPANSWLRSIVDLLIGAVALVFPLAYIWFAEDLAEYFRDGNLFPRITTSSRPVFVRLGGWILLALPILVYFLTRLLESLYLN